MISGPYRGGARMALPIIQVAGSERYDEILMPVSLALADRCDACLRIGGTSGGADQEVERVQAQGKLVYRRLEEIPRAVQ
jgi:hypothetical protein